MLSDYDVSLGYDSNEYVNKFTITGINNQINLPPAKKV